MVPVIDRASQSCVDCTGDVAGISRSDTSQTAEPDREALLRPGCRARGARRRCRVCGNVYLAGSRNGDTAREVPHQALQVLDAKRAYPLVDGSFARNSYIRSLVRDLAVRNGFPDRPQIAAGKLRGWISTISGFG